jgi:hypothetical protein
MPQSLLLSLCQIRPLVLRKRKEHQQPVRGHVPEVDNPAATTLSAAPARPTNLPQSSRSGNDISGCWPTRQMNLKFAVLLIAQ